MQLTLFPNRRNWAEDGVQSCSVEHRQDANTGWNDLKAQVLSGMWVFRETQGNQ